jgi:hypothetical protein
MKKKLESLKFLRFVMLEYLSAYGLQLLFPEVDDVNYAYIGDDLLLELEPGGQVCCQEEPVPELFGQRATAVVKSVGQGAYVLMADGRQYLLLGSDGEPLEVIAILPQEQVMKAAIEAAIKQLKYIIEDILRERVKAQLTQRFVWEREPFWRNSVK